MGRIVGLVFKDTPKQETTKLACPHCGKEYATEDGLANHIKSKHPEAAGDPGSKGGQE